MARKSFKVSQTEWIIAAAAAGIGWLTAVLGVGRPDSVPWFESIASLLWIGLLIWLDYAERLRSETRAKSGALARGSGEDLSAPSARWSWLGASALAIALGLTPQSLLVVPGIMAGLGRRSSWQKAGWRALALSAAAIGLAFLWPNSPWRQHPWMSRSAPFESSGSTLLALFTLAVLAQLGHEVLLLVRSPRLDRPGKHQSAFFAASTAFLLVLSFGSASLQQLTLWPCAAAGVLRAESLKQRVAALAILLLALAYLIALLIG